MKNILMNVEMTKAILDGRKVQTRRALVSVKDAGVEFKRFKLVDGVMYCQWDDDHKAKRIKQPIEDFIKQEAKYQIGETIWVREPARVVEHHSKHDTMEVEYLSDKKREVISIPEKYIGYLETSFGTLSVYTKWIQLQQGIPNGCIKEMARIFLKITDVRVERLHDISDEDIGKEIQSLAHGNHYERHIEMKDRQEFIRVWNKTAPKGYKWEDNPYVFVYEFERAENV